jgi:predicted metal-dependent hydrolase
MLPFEYQVVRAARKTLAVYVRNARVEVRAPRFVSEHDIEQFVHQHQRWISRKLEHNSAQAEQLLYIRDGVTIFYKARNLRLALREPTVTHPQEGVSIEPGAFIIFCKGADQKRARHVFEAWLLGQARAYLPARTRALAVHLGVGHKLKEVVFRKTKTKWGHCTSSGRIQYNWLIMLAPDAIIDYMISHETCHLLQMNHSKAYWRHVESVCPEYRFYVAWLKRHEHRLWPAGD